MDEEPIVVSGQKADNRRVKMIAAVGVALFLLVAVVPKLLGGGGGGGEVTEFPTAAPSNGASTPAPAAAPVPETFQGFTSKNPFTPLIDLDGADAGPAPDPAPVVPASTDFGTPPATVPVDGGVVVWPIPTSPDPTPTEPTDSPTTPIPTRQPDRVGLLEVYTDLTGKPVASVRVNDTTSQVAPGDQFAESYEVISIDLGARCADFLFGDDRFRLCEGDEVQK